MSCNGKRRFKSIEHAKRSMTSIKFSSSIEMRWYECEKCSGYHLASSKFGDFTERKDKRKTRVNHKRGKNVW